MKRTVTALVVVALFIPYVGFAADPAIRDAGSKIRGEAMAGHEARSYTESARHHAHYLYYYAQPEAPVKLTPKKADEHITGAKTNIENAEKAIAVLKAKYETDKDVTKDIAAIEKLLASAKTGCGTCAEHCLKQTIDHMKTMACCVGMYADLKSAGEQIAALLKKLKIESLPEPKPAAPAKK